MGAAEAVEVMVVEPDVAGEVVTPPARAIAEAPAPCDERLGPYRLRFALATGGMATVYLAVAEDGPARGEVFAVKRIHPHLALQHEFVEMFLDEARIASLLHHPNVCGVLDYGEARDPRAPEGGASWWLAMEFLLGEPLARVMAARARVCADEASQRRWPYLVARLLADACEGLHAAHELRDPEGRALRVVHRDVSPHNLVVGFDGRLKVVDFGIATAEHRVHRTATGMVKGKFAYMAPEQMRGHKLDRRADVWSVGVVLWEALAGRSLFRTGNESETILRVLGAKVPALDEIAPHVPAELAAIVGRALQLAPAHRHESARELGRELARFADTAAAASERREITAWMERMFPGERARQEQLVRRALADGTGAAAPSWPVPASPSEASASGRLPRSAVVRRHSDGPVRARRPWLAGAALVVGACALAVGMILGSAGVAGAPGRRPVAPPAAVVPTAPGVTALAAAVAVPAPVEPPSPGAPPGAPSAEGAAAARTERDDRRSRGGERDREHERRGFEEVGRGEVHVATSGGWAQVSHRGRTLGPTPGRFLLPAGRQTLTLRPSGIGAPRRVSVHVRAGAVARVRVDLREPAVAQR